MRWMVETAYSAFKYFGEFASAKVWIYKLFEGCSLLKYRRGLVRIIRQSNAIYRKYLRIINFNSC